MHWSPPQTRWRWRCAAALTRPTSRPAPTSRPRSSTPTFVPSPRASPSRCTWARWWSWCRGRCVNMAPGDAIITNDPYRGGVHLNDIPLIAPVHYEGQLFGYVANLAHHVDVGGGAPASIGAFREVFQEGVIIPPVRLVKSGRIVDDVFRLVLAQIRSKHETGGDFRAQVAAGNTGVRRLKALLDRHGSRLVGRYMAEILAYTERRTRAELEKLPRGVFE